MAKRSKKNQGTEEGDAQTGRQSIIAAELPELTPEEQASRVKLMQQVAQELHGVERKLERRNIERLDLKGKLDKVADECKSLDARANAMRREIVEILEGRATGRLPFGPGVAAEKPVTVDDLKTTPAKLAECYYAGLWQALQVDEAAVPSVSKAITLEGSDNRFVLVDDPSGHRRLLTLHPSGWQPNSSEAALKGITGRNVDFMEAKLVIGTQPECPLVLVELPGDDVGRKHGSGGRTDPGGATRGAAIDRARQEVGNAIDTLLNSIRVEGLLEQPTDETTLELHQFATLIAFTGKPYPVRWLNTATLDDLNTTASSMKGIGDDRTKWAEVADRVKKIVLDGFEKEPADDFDDSAADAGGTFERTGPAGEPELDDAPEGEGEEEEGEEGDDAGDDDQDDDAEGAEDDAGDDGEAAEGDETTQDTSEGGKRRKSPGKGRGGKAAKKRGGKAGKRGGR